MLNIHKNSNKMFINHWDDSANPSYEKNKLEEAIVSDEYDEFNILKKQREYILSKVNNVNRYPKALMVIADIHYKKKDYSRALNAYLQIINLEAFNIIAYKKAINSAKLLGKNDLIESLYENLIKQVDHRTDILHEYVLYRLYAYQSDEKKLEESISDLNNILNLEPDNFSVLNTFGLIQLNFKNNIKLAKKFFQKSLKINNNFVHALNNLGLCFLIEGESETALKYFITANEKDSFYVIAYENIASLHIGNKNYKEALAILERSRNKGLVLSNPWEHNYGWMLLLNKKYDLAIKWHENKIEEEPNNDLLFNNLGVCYREIGNLSKAKSFFSKARVIFLTRKIGDIRSLNSFYNLARLALDFDEIDKADKIADEILRISGKDVFANLIKGYVCISKNDFDNARTYLNNSYHDEVQRKRFPEIYVNYSFFLACIEKDYDKAIEVCLEAIRLGQKSKNIFNNLAYSYAKAKKFKQALDILNKLVSEKYAGAFATKGFIEFSKGNEKKGDEYFLKAIKIFEKTDNKWVKLANQVWLYEKAILKLSLNKKLEANKLLNEAKKLGDSYILRDIDNLDL